MPNTGTEKIKRDDVRKEMKHQREYQLEHHFYKGKYKNILQTLYVFKMHNILVQVEYPKFWCQSFLLYCTAERHGRLAFNHIIGSPKWGPCNCAVT